MLKDRREKEAVTAVLNGWRDDEDGGSYKWNSVAYIWSAGGVCGRPAARHVLADRAWIGLAQGCCCALPLQAWEWAYRGGRPPTACLLYLAIFRVAKMGILSQSTCLFAYMPFNTEDHILITNLYLLIQYAAKKKLLKEFPSKSWCKRSLLRLTKKFKYQFSWQDIQGAADHNFTLWRMWPCCWPQVKPGRCGTDTSVSTWNFKKYWNCRSSISCASRHLFQSHPPIEKQRAYLAANVFSGSVATQQRWGEKSCTHSEAMIFIVPKSMKIGSSYFKS